MLKSSIKSWIKKLAVGQVEYDQLTEGFYADQYPEDDLGGLRQRIRREYQQRWPQPNTNPTPRTHPWLYDPCDPPQGWRYDPYYELWIEYKL